MSILYTGGLTCGAIPQVVSEFRWSVVPVWQSLDPLEPGEYEVNIGWRGGSLERTAFTVTPEKTVSDLTAGITPLRVICKNRRTGQRVVIPGAASAWNCETSGLRVKPGDRIDQKIIGKVNRKAPFLLVPDNVGRTAPSPQ